MTRNLVPHSSHWGAFEAEVADGTVVAIRPYRNDPDPSPLLGNIVDSLRHPPRVTPDNSGRSTMQAMGPDLAVLPPEWRRALATSVAVPAPMSHRCRGSWTLFAADAARRERSMRRARFATNKRTSRAKNAP